MQEKQSILAPIIRTSAVVLILCGVIYPLAATGIAQGIMPHKANGSLVYDEKKRMIGSELIGQNFKEPQYFQGRISSIENDGAGSGSANYAPSNKEMIERTKASVEEWKKANSDTPVSELPIDLISNSGSGLDPHISPESAFAQIKRISKETGLSEEQLRNMVKQRTEGRELGLFGEPRVNVLMLNLDLKKML